MTLRRPAATLVLDGSSLTAPEAAVVGLQVELGVGGGHDRFRAVAASASPAADAEPGATAEVRLGYGDDLTAVLAGTVTSVERLSAHVVVEGLAGTAALSKARVGRSYVRQTVAGIVSDLVDSAGAESGEIAAPLALAAYHVDERRSVWQHVRALARLAACEVTSDDGGALNFRPPKPAASADRALRYGADLVAWSVGPRDGETLSFTVVAFGAASEQGADKWHLLLKEPDGGSPPGPTLVPAALRDRDGAQTFEGGLRRAATRRRTEGWLLLLGDAVIRAGDVVELVDVPSAAPGPLRVTAASHHFDARAGFRTALRVEGAG